MVTLVILLIGALSITALRIAALRANFSGDRMIQASSLATDLEESVKRWDYNDARLHAGSSIGMVLDGGIAVPPSTWDMGTSQTVPYVANFSDFATGPTYPTPNATTPSALGTPYP